MCWMGWDQAKKPFNEELKSYIRKINIMEDMNRLSKAVKMREVIKYFLKSEMLEKFQNR